VANFFTSRHKEANPIKKMSDLARRFSHFPFDNRGNMPDNVPNNPIEKLRLGHQSTTPAKPDQQFIYSPALVFMFGASLF
jgi:hypothetical protein